MSPTAVCILGMHRSGTSAITRALNLAGVYLGEERDMMVPLPENPEGFWERKDLMEFHDGLLMSMGRRWDATDFLPEGWHRFPETAPFRDRLEGLVGSVFDGHPLWGWKDPRCCLLFPLWADVLERRGMALKPVVVIRNPLDVALSLRKRNGFPLEKGFRLWYVHMLSVLRALRHFSFPVVEYDRFMDDPQGVLNDIFHELSVDPPVSPETLGRQLGSLVRRDLRHSRSSLDDLRREGAPAQVVALYSLLGELAGRPGPHRHDELSTALADLTDYPYEEPTPRFTISIAVHDNLHLTMECLQTLFSRTPPGDFELIVTDNGSRDGTAGYLTKLAKEKPQVRVVTRPCNEGFVRAHDRALDLANGEYFVVLNNDLFIREDGWLSKLVVPFQRDPLVRLTGISGRRLSSDGVGGLTGEGEVEYLEGCCLVIPTRFAREIGLFDETFDLAYGEDVDLSLRIRRMGCRIALVECAHHHVGNPTAALIAPFRLKRARDHNHELIRKRWGGYLATRRFAGRTLVRVASDQIVDHLAATPVIDRLRRLEPTVPIDVVSTHPEVFKGFPGVELIDDPGDSPDGSSHDRVIVLDPRWGNPEEPVTLRYARQAGVVVDRLAPLLCFPEGGGSVDTGRSALLSMSLPFAGRVSLRRELECRGYGVMTVTVGEGGSFMKEVDGRGFTFTEACQVMRRADLFVGGVDHLLYLAQGIVGRVFGVVGPGDDPLALGIDRERCMLIGRGENVPLDQHISIEGQRIMQAELIQRVFRSGWLEEEYAALIRSSDAERSRLLDEVIRRTSELVLLKNSLTWRLTRPLRSLLDRFARNRRRLE